MSLALAGMYVTCNFHLSSILFYGLCRKLLKCFHMNFLLQSQELKESVQSDLRHQVTLLVRPMQQVNTSFHDSI